MKRHINSPYKLNLKMYSLIGGVSMLIMIIAVIRDADTGNLFLDVVKNLAFGCVASTIVALLIEIGNVKEKNERADSLYDAVYVDLKWKILYYIKTWARLCDIAFNDKDHQGEKHTWIEWYEMTKSYFLVCDGDKQTRLIHFFKDELLYSISGVENALRQIESQQYMLSVNDMLDEKLRGILEDFRFGFDAARGVLQNAPDMDFWKMYDAIEQDLINYIHSWVDIRYYNYLKLVSTSYGTDTTDIMNAVLESEKETSN